MSGSEATSEGERYVALPGQACAYKEGELKILQLVDEWMRRDAPKRGGVCDGRHTRVSVAPFTRYDSA